MNAVDAVFEATLQINTIDGCDSDIEDSTTEVYLKLRQQFLITVRIVLADFNVLYLFIYQFFLTVCTTMH